MAAPAAAQEEPLAGYSHGAFFLRSEGDDVVLAGGGEVIGALAGPDAVRAVFRVPLVGVVAVREGAQTSGGRLLAQQGGGALLQQVDGWIFSELVIADGRRGNRRPHFR